MTNVPFCVEKGGKHILTIESKKKTVLMNRYKKATIAGIASRLESFGSYCTGDDIAP